MPVLNDVRSFGEDVKARRQELRFTLQQAAARANLSLSGWKAIEAGGPSVPRRSTILAIAAALDWSPAEALRKAGEDPGPEELTEGEWAGPSIGVAEIVKLWDQLSPKAQRDVHGIIKALAAQNAGRPRR